MPRIKICFVLWSLAGGGAERFFLILLKHLDRARFDIHLILFNASGEYQSFLPSDIQVTDLHLPPGASLANTPRHLFYVRKFFADLRPEIIFSTMGYTNLICMAAKSISPSLSAKLMIHESGILRNELSFARLAILKKWIYLFFCRFADAIVFPVSAVKDDFSGYLGMNSEKFKVIPTPTDLDYIEKQSLKPWIPEQFELKTDRKVIISVGRLERIKGMDLGLKAFAELRRKIPCYYWILGQGTEESNLRRLARELEISEDVFFLGFQENPFIFLKNADVCLLPSYSETLPYTLIEAMCCRCACVITPFNQSVDEIITDGETGIVVDRFDPGPISTAIYQLFGNDRLRESIEQKAWQKVQDFSAGKVVQVYGELFASSISNKIL